MSLSKELIEFMRWYQEKFDDEDIDFEQLYDEAGSYSKRSKFPANSSLERQLTDMLLGADIDFLSQIDFIPSRAFKYNSGLKLFKCPNHIREIGQASFAFCTNLQTFVFPETLELIGTQAFRGIENLGEVTLPDSLEILSGGTFSISKIQKISIGPKTKLAFHEFSGSMIRQLEFRGTAQQFQQSNLWKGRAIKFGQCSIDEILCSDGQIPTEEFYQND